MPRSPSGLGPLGSGSDGRLRSGSGGRASLSGLPELDVARAPLSLSGGREGPLAASEAGGPVGPLAAEQLPSVSVSAGGAGGPRGRALPLSAVLHLGPALPALSGLLQGLWRPLLADLAQVQAQVDRRLLAVRLVLGVAVRLVGVAVLVLPARPVAPPLRAAMVTAVTVAMTVSVVVAMTVAVVVVMTVPVSPLDLDLRGNGRRLPRLLRNRPVTDRLLLL